MAYNVKFVQGTKSQYDAANKDANTIYFLTDVEEIYLGSKKYTSKEEIGSLSALAEGITGDARKNLVAAINAVMAKTGDFAINIEVATNASEGAAKTYVVSQGESEIARIDIPKDMVVSSGVVETKAEAGAWGAAGTYIVLTVANAAADKLYIPVDKLVDIYTVVKNATQVQLALSEDNELSATIVAGSIGETELAAGAVTSAKLGAAAVTSAAIASAAVKADAIDAGAVTSAKLGNGAVTSAAIASAAVKADAIDEGAVTSAKIAEAAVTSAAIGAAAVTSAAMATDSVQSAAIANGAVGTAKLADEVTTKFVGTASDAASADTINGAKAYTDAALTWGSFPTA